MREILVLVQHRVAGDESQTTGLGVFEQRPVGVVPARRDLLILLVEELGLVENVRELVDDRVERFFELVLIRSVEIIDVQQQNLQTAFGLT